MLKFIIYMAIYGSLFFAISKKTGPISNKSALIGLSILVTFVALFVDVIVSQYFGGPQAKPSNFANLAVGFIFYNIMKPVSEPSNPN